ncbi:MAG: nucleoside-diphosphate kinase [Candidatus Andersenbacteria bacterium]|nr:nucleoside-diphosphate kinase [bacterium]MDZ4225425.1 nucleoside-diphosphate kinase [Candidatus Andersenbacteria bacterium]
MAIERTLAIVKPDGVQRGLMGEILHRFERAGLKVVGMKMVWADKELVGKHYADDEAYLISVGEKALAAARERGQEMKQSALEIGKRVRESNMRYVATGPVLALVLQGNTAVQTVRNIVGGTNPLTADIGTIRGDLTIDDFTQADSEERSARNLMHASGNVAEAEREIALWFKDDELHEYQTVMDKVLHDPNWDKE